jgi:hypothetical protein
VVYLCCPREAGTGGDLMQKRRFLHAAAALILTAAIPAAPSSGDFYRYVDRNGTVYYTDGSLKPPPGIGEISTSCPLPSPTAGPRVTHVAARDNRVLVPVRVGYRGREKDVVLLLDTGASSTIIYAKPAEGLRIDGNEGRRISGTVAGGGRIEGTRVRVWYLAVGPHSKYDFEVDIVEHQGDPPPYDGLLGMNFLRDYRYTVDFDCEMILWDR